MLLDHPDLGPEDWHADLYGEPDDRPEHPVCQGPGPLYIIDANGHSIPAEGCPACAGRTRTHVRSRSILSAEARRLLAVIEERAS